MCFCALEVRGCSDGCGVPVLSSPSFLPPFCQQGPALKKLCEQLAKELGSDTETITRRLEGLHECNPMMGLRGCRLGTVHPEITAMQVGVVCMGGCWYRLGLQGSET